MEKLITINSKTGVVPKAFSRKLQFQTFYCDPAIYKKKSWYRFSNIRILKFSYFTATLIQQFILGADPVTVVKSKEDYSRLYLKGYIEVTLSNRKKNRKIIYNKSYKKKRKTHWKESLHTHTQNYVLWIENRKINWIQLCSSFIFSYAHTTFIWFERKLSCKLKSFLFYMCIWACIWAFFWTQIGVFMCVCVSTLIHPSNKDKENICFSLKCSHHLVTMNKLQHQTPTGWKFSTNKFSYFAGESF